MFDPFCSKSTAPFVENRGGSFCIAVQIAEAGFGPTIVNWF